MDAVLAAVGKGGEIAGPVAAAVVGAGGELVAFLRANGSPGPSAKIAQDKAYSAASFRVSTTALYQMVSGNRALRDGISAQPGVVLFGGGLPIEIDGEIVGAIGVSGASEEQDIECAGAGLAAIGARPFP
ncbi:GlcG/HbpS family heme-binding protein [Tsuneonella sp. HG094]